MVTHRPRILPIQLKRTDTHEFQCPSQKILYTSHSTGALYQVWSLHVPSAYINKLGISTKMHLSKILHFLPWNFRPRLSLQASAAMILQPLPNPNTMLKAFQPLPNLSCAIYGRLELEKPVHRDWVSDKADESGNEMDASHQKPVDEVGFECCVCTSSSMARQ